MKRNAFSDYDTLLARIEGSAAEPSWTRRCSHPRRWSAAQVFMLGAALLLLPFFALVGASVYLYRFFDTPTWPALFASVLLTGLVLLLYAAWASKKLTGRLRLARLVRRTVPALVAGYLLYSLIYLSSLNVKDESIRGYYRSLHPLLRVAVSTFILLDTDLIITDMRRTPDDYKRMGLPVAVSSMHYPQRDGYVHAVDLRTIGSTPMRNAFLAAYFRIMGFRTLRHVGTADHLHVSLPLPG